jgi:hypothetical protein
MSTRAGVDDAPLNAWTVSRQIIEIAFLRFHRQAIDFEIDLTVKNVIGLVPVVPVGRWAHPERNILLE